MFFVGYLVSKPSDVWYDQGFIILLFFLCILRRLT